MPVETNAVQPFIVDQLFRSNELHLIFGPLSEDNTSLALYFLARWRVAARVFGHASHPAPFVYVACERTKSFIRHAIDREGMDDDPAMTPHLSLIGSRSSSEDGIEGAIRAATELNPDVRVLFIDGIYSLCPGRIYDYRDVSRFLKSSLESCQQRELTIIACCTTVKAKANEGYVNPLDRLHGSGAWATMTATKIHIEPVFPSKVTDHGRVVTVFPMNMPPKRFPFRYSDDERYVLRPAPSMIINAVTLDTWLSEQPTGRTITTQELLVLAMQIDVSKSALYRWIACQLEISSLTSTSRGTYVVAPRTAANTI